MDSYREHPGEFEPASAATDEEAPSAGGLDIGGDERRMHVRAYNHWASLLDGRDFPSIEDLEPGDLDDFAPHSVLLDFTAGRDNPATAFIGEALRAECELGAEVHSIADVPSRSLLSRLTDHYMQIIANRAPVGFEAEFANQRGVNIRYRGILMPFSSDGDTIDFIYGVINWKSAGEDNSGEAPFQPGATGHDDDEAAAPIALTQGLADSVDWDAGNDLAAAEAEPEPIELAGDAGLGDRLWAARENAEAAKAADGRSRHALYKALGHAYDFALASREDPQTYAELLEDSGVKPQARSPMTAVAKLVFGADYDKARLTEFAAALTFADRRQVAPGGFLALVEAQAGGLKGLVAAERQARRPEPRADTGLDAARAKLRRAAPLHALASGEEFALVLTRRSSDGSHQPIALVEDPGLVERAIRRAA